MVVKKVAAKKVAASKRNLVAEKAPVVSSNLQQVAPKKRGRPMKAKNMPVVEGMKKRGRPRKEALQQEAQLRLSKRRRVQRVIYDQ